MSSDSSEALSTHKRGHTDPSSDSSSVSAISHPRTHPNILICGTPGTGKTTTASLLALLTSYTLINIGEVVAKHSFHSGYSQQHDALILDEDLLLDHLEPLMAPGGIILDHHGCDLFPERWLDLVVVLQTDNTTLYKRLEGRKYADSKIRENVECEIMQVILDEARDCYSEDVVKVLQSDSLQQMEINVETIGDWVDALEIKLRARCTID